jgi:serine/threonine protein kinase
VRVCLCGACSGSTGSPGRQCESEFVTKYYGSYLKGYQLWIIMEFLGGGSALDLVRAFMFVCLCML